MCGGAVDFSSACGVFGQKPVVYELCDRFNADPRHGAGADGIYALFAGADRAGPSGCKRMLVKEQ